MLTPDRVSVPLPTLTSEPPVPPDAPPSAMTPLTSVEKLLPPTVSVFEPRKKVPAPSIEPAVIPVGGQARYVDHAAGIVDEAELSRQCSGL